MKNPTNYGKVYFFKKYSECCLWFSLTKLKRA